jgi:hypothetical protein
MLRAAAVVTLIAVAAPMAPLHAGVLMAHDRCPMTHDDCTRAVAFSCCGPGTSGQDEPAMTSARTIVKDAKKLVTGPGPATVLPPLVDAAVLAPSTVRHVTPPRQRLAQLSVLLI